MDYQEHKHLWIELEDDMGGEWRKCQICNKLEVVKDNKFAKAIKAGDLETAERIADGLNAKSNE